jgi:hypothetical protein
MRITNDYISIIGYWGGIFLLVSRHRHHGLYVWIEDSQQKLLRTAAN